MEIKKHLSSTKVLYSIICLLLVLCVVLSLLLISHYRDDKRAEALYMKNVYADLQDIISQSDALAEEGVALDAQAEDLAALRFALRSVTGQLEDGHAMITGCIPGAAAFWFDEAAADLLSTEQLLEQGGLSAEDMSYLAQLNKDMQGIVDQLVGEDQLNLDEEITIEDFSAVIWDFYYNQ